MNDATQFNLIVEPLLGVRTDDGAAHAVSLSDTLARLQRGETLEFTGLQAHQMHAWHAFLCQIAAAALHAAGLTIQDQISTERWSRLLLSLAEERIEPWCLFVADLSQPAFLQPPVPEGSLSAFKNSAEQPDLLDLLVTAKNHDIKRRRVAHPRPEHWAYSLVSLQTTDGFAGRNNYGVARMNGGYGSRSYISAAKCDDWAVRFRRDTTLLLETRQEIVDRFGFRAHSGVTLLWTLEWDGVRPLELPECDPFFIEVCRRVRLGRKGNVLVARFTGTQAARISAGEARGNLGDPWIPIRIEDAAALTPKSLSYSVLQMVLFGQDYYPSAACRLRSEDGESPIVIGRVLVRGQGGTEGYHERVIPCPPRARALLGTRDGRVHLGSIAKLRVETVALVKRKLLKPAIAALLQGGPETINFDDDRADRIAQRIESRVDDVFFASLFSDIDLDPGEAKQSWERQVLEFALEILDEATAGVPIPQARRYRAISSAQRILHGAARKHFPDLFLQTGDSTNDLEPKSL